MRKLIVSEFVSLDMVMQAPGASQEDTEGDFRHGGWTHPYWHNDIGMNFFNGFSQADAFLLGRKTWQIHGAAFNPAPAGDVFMDLMNSMPKYVVSSTLANADAWRNSTIIRQDVVEQVRALKQQPGKDIFLDGSAQLVATLAQHDLVDEYSLAVYPLVLGSGKRLFPADLRVNLTLVESRPLPSGVVLMRYQPARS
jgi:dihydrofolate reductase